MAACARLRGSERRRDPAPRSPLKLVCGRFPDDADLASQPTLSRLENAVDFKACYHLARAFVHLYLQERERAGIPEHILTDLDGTDDPAHGKQEGGAYHGFYGQYMVRHEVARSEWCLSEGKEVTSTASRPVSGPVPTSASITDNGGVILGPAPSDVVERAPEALDSPA